MKTMARTMFVISLGLTVNLAPAAQGEMEPARPPNIILLMADDMGYGDVGAYNAASKIPTPNIDQLARQGIRFTDAHSSAPICIPSRYSLVTGQYLWRTGNSHSRNYFQPPLIEYGRMTIASMLQDHGYTTGAIGKWQLGLNIRLLDGEVARWERNEPPPAGIDWTAPVEGGPIDYGFDYYFGAPSSVNKMRAFVEDRHYIGTPVRSPDGYSVPGWIQSLQETIQLKKALEFISHHHRDNQDNSTEEPFFLYYASARPHAPWTPAEYLNGHPVRGVSEDGNHGDEVVEFDVIVGEIWQEIQTLGLADETLIVVTSDNGPDRNASSSTAHDPRGGLRGSKQDLWEGGHRVPFIVHWGDGNGGGAFIPPGSVSDQVIGLHDLMATVADLIGMDLPPDAAEDSESILATVLGEQLDGPARNPLVHQSASGRFAVRDSEWKLILADDPTTESIEEGQLYNLVRDLLETNNVLTQRPDVVARLSGTLDYYELKGASTSRLVGVVPAPGALQGGAVVLLYLVVVRGGVFIARRKRMHLA